MNHASRFVKSHVKHRFVSAHALLFSVVLVFGPALSLSAIAQRRAQRGHSSAQTLTDEQRILHVLTRLTYGPRPGDLERVAAMGVNAYIAQQLDPDSINDDALTARLGKLPTLALATPALAEQYNPPKPPPVPKPTPAPKNPQQVVTELQRAALLRAVYSERQLSELTVDFWENHFSIYAQKDADRWLLTSFDRDAIRPYALGRFRDLLGAT